MAVYPSLLYALQVIKAEACSTERALAIVCVRSLLNGSVRHSKEASACEQSRALASAEQASGVHNCVQFVFTNLAILKALPTLDGIFHLTEFCSK
jgi:hypothetical protein